MFNIKNVGSLKTSIKSICYPGELRHKEKIGITNVRNVRGNITTESMEIERILNTTNNYAHKYGNLNEMSQFLEKHICQNAYKKK